MLSQNLHDRILRLIGLGSISSSQVIQNLWSGYGQILRINLEGSEYPSTIVKHVNPPSISNHPRGWNSDISHLRKLRSYQIELNWYKNFSSKCNDSCTVPSLISAEQSDNDFLIILQDMDAYGFPARLTNINQKAFNACLSWLANFHATFLNTPIDGLWESGCYWHLETRPQELEALDDLALKKAASAIDLELKASPFQTLVHGDAKLANFCFSEDSRKVAAVDFQYIGKGCGIKDLAYFVGSCLNEEQCESQEQDILDYYFCELRKATQKTHPQINCDDLEQDWRRLYPYAWADFHRFLKGWSPGHWKINSYSERICREVIKDLEQSL
ncbi:phosphotransferase [Lentisphaera profundi]|uniref:Phosphotransferase n=1 Tax=Lentisphaera profundi TaxID=1658616 RepID=A0ABY7VZ39_9BACT|nr:phosphotransferase [Lentisphaera profundi]WDE99196.1 phosphotransferase [Lentisphaera profundi]